MGAAFSEEVLVNRTNSDLIEPEPDVLRAIVLRVADHRESATRPLAEVRDEVIEAVRLERARDATLKAAEQVAEQLRQGLDWSDVLPGATVERPGLVDRNHADLPVPVRTLAFKLSAPTEGEASVGTTGLAGADVAVVQVIAVQEGEPTPTDPSASADQTSAIAEAEMLAQLIGRNAYEAMLDDIERRAKVERLASPTSGSEL
jgi:peptidyl-prolyl cis-trans isomerase D